MSNSELIAKKYSEATKGIKDEWFTKANSKWFDYVSSLPMDLQATYMVVILENQVINGGFHQYFVNGYGQFADKTIGHLITIGALEKAKLLKQAFKIVNVANDNIDVFRANLLSKKIDALFVEDDLFDPLDELDKVYYDAEDIEKALGNYLANNGRN